MAEMKFLWGERAVVPFENLMKANLTSSQKMLLCTISHLMWVFWIPGQEPLDVVVLGGST